MGQAKGDHAYLVFMLLLSLFALVALGIEAVFPIDEGTREILGVADTTVCVLFFVDFVVSLRNAEHKLRYLVTWGWLDLLSSIPAIGVLRLGRTARIARILRVMRAVRAGRVLSVFIIERRKESALFAAMLLSIVLVAVSSIAVLHFEIPYDGNIKTGEDALWWAMTTITTVGYGDKYPVSTEGRALAIGLMVMGVGLFATLSGVLASWFMGSAQAQRDDELAMIRNELAEVKQMLAAMSVREQPSHLDPR